MFVFWVVTPCKLVGKDQSPDKYTVSIIRAEGGGSMFLQNVSIYLHVLMA
jgi:hypothetical protein